jgi:cyclopentanol dehydrogenase
VTVKEKTILIAGGAGGLGRAISQRLAENEAIVFVLDLDEEKGPEIAADIHAAGGEAYFVKADLTDEKEWLAAVQYAIGKTGRLDVLINNVGINIRKPIEEMSSDEWDTMMRVNVGSIFLGCKACLPIMRRQKDGVIINTSSICGLIGHRYTTEAYTASKGAVNLLTRSIAARYAKDGVRCNCINPSTVDTPLVQTLFQDPARKKERLDEIPLGHLAAENDIAYAILYLASEEARFINGVALPIDGGLTCC